MLRPTPIECTHRGVAGISERVYEDLREQILDWTLPPGAPLGEVELASRLGVSRTPLRTALSRLVADGLAVARAGRGVSVAQVSVRDLRDVFELRTALEGQAARLAAARRDEAVFAALVAELDARGDALPGRTGSGTDAAAAAAADHEAYYELVRRMDEAIDEASGNRYLVEALRGLRTHVARLRRLAQDDPARLAAAAREHRLIAEAIRDGDGDLAVHAVHVHLHASLQAVLARLTPAGARPTTPAPTLQEAHR